MKTNTFIINLTSEDPDRLRAFYRDVVGLELLPDMGPGAFLVTAEGVLAIDEHSDTHGMTKEPHRVLINFMVDDVRSEQDRLKAKGVAFIREEGREEWGGIISTFADPDGNLCQLIQWKQGA